MRLLSHGFTYGLLESVWYGVSIVGNVVADRFPLGLGRPEDRFLNNFIAKLNFFTKF